MGRKERKMVFRSKLASLMGAKQQCENRVIRVQEIATATGMTRAAIYRWLDEKNGFKSLDGDSAYQLCNYFNCGIDDLVEFVALEDESTSIS